MHLNKRPEECCGCGACAAKCPKQAILMKPDELGFLYPHIDYNKCVDCGICVKTCKFSQDNDGRNHLPLEVYGGRLKDKVEVAKSQSGGAFYAIACKFIESDGVVYGASLLNDLSVKHIRVTTHDELEKLRGSKYIQSNLNGIFHQVKQDLKDNKKILFSGTPCQVSGLKSFVSGERNINMLFTIDLVCHAVPSPKIFDDYVQWIEKKYNKKVLSCNFRDKKFGWGSHEETFIFADKSSVSDSILRKLFYQHLIVRESCHNCPFSNLNRHSDITVGDYWGWKRISTNFCDNKGVSLFLINTEKGDALFNAAKDLLEYERSNTQDCLQPQLQAPAARPKNKDNFLLLYSTKGFNYVIHKFAIVGYKSKIKKSIEAIDFFVKKVKFNFNRIISKFYL